MSLRTKLHPMGGGSNENIFIRPNLTSNGTLGGNSFAVTASTNISNYPAYYAVDSSTSTYWRSGTSTTTYTFYNPTALKVTKIILTCASASSGPATVAVAGSKNNSSYTTIASSVSGIGTTTVTITLTNTTYYKYYRLQLTPRANYIYIADMAITATFI